MLSIFLALQIAASPHDALRYDITLVPADTGTHLLGETETTWRLSTADPVAVELDSSMRVVRVLIDGRPNTRLSRTMYGRSEHDVLVPHQKQAGDSITTRVRYHGLARRGATLRTNRGKARIFFATGQREQARFWTPVPGRTAYDLVTASFRIQAPSQYRVIAPGVLEKIDTLPYGHSAWRYRMDTPAPIAALGAAAGPYRVHVLTPGRCGDGCPVVEVWRYSDQAGVGGFGPLWEMVEFYSARAGRYPYSRLAYVEAPVDAAVGAPGIVFHPEGLGGGATAVDSVLALETARQWFGASVSPAAEEDRRLIDGLAVFLADAWRKRSARPQAPVPRDSVGHRAVGELELLRAHAGDSTFFAGLRAFAGERMHQSATRADFVRAMSAATGRDVARDLPQTLGRAR